MLKKVLRSFRNITKYSRFESITRACSQVATKDEEIVTNTHPETTVIDTQLLDTRIDSDVIKEKPPSVLEKCDEDISYIAPYLKPTFNFAAYVNKSKTLQELLKMGVNLHKIEKTKDAAQYILSLKFENDMKGHIMFFHNLGLSIETIANIITRNPFIFKEDIENLEVRINYLKYKKYTHEMVLRIIERNPLLLSHSTKVIDNMLGFLKKHFDLTADELRKITTSKPKLITYNQRHIKLNTFTVKEEMGFTPEQTKEIILKCPTIFMKNEVFILKTYEYVHNEMNIDLETIAKVPEVLACRHHRIRQRHLFLEKLDKAQFDPKKPNYVSLLSLVSGDDAHFCTEIAKSSIQTYNAFLKTM